MDAVTIHIEDATAHTKTTTAHIEAAEAYMAPGTINPPFGHAMTAHEKMTNLFLTDISETG